MHYHALTRIYSVLERSLCANAVLLEDSSANIRTGKRVREGHIVRLETRYQASNCAPMALHIAYTRKDDGTTSSRIIAARATEMSYRTKRRRSGLFLLTSADRSSSSNLISRLTLSLHRIPARQFILIFHRSNSTFRQPARTTRLCFRNSLRDRDWALLHFGGLTVSQNFHIIL